MSDDISDEDRLQHRELWPLFFSNSASTLPLSKALYLGGEKTNLGDTLFQYLVKGFVLSRNAIATQVKAMCCHSLYRKRLTSTATLDQGMQSMAGQCRGFAWSAIFCAKTCSSVRSWQRVECVAFFSSNKTSKQSLYLGPCHLPKQFVFYIMMFTWHNNNTFRIIYNKRSATIKIAVSTRQLLSNFSDLEQLLILSSNFSNFVQLFWITFKAICN